MIWRDPDAFHTQTLTEFDIEIFIADHPTFRRIEIILLDRPFSHTGLRFAAITIIFWSMRTEEDIVDPPSAGPDLRYQFMIDRFKF